MRQLGTVRGIATEEETWYMQDMFNFEAPVPLHIFQFNLMKARQEQHWHSFYEIGYCMEGSGTFYIGDEAVSITQGDLMFFPPYERHIAVSDDVGICRCSFIYFSDALIPDEDRHLLWSLRETIIEHQHDLRDDALNFPDLHRLIQRIFDEYTTKPVGYSAMLRSCVLEICIHLHRMEARNQSRDRLESRLKGFRQIKPALDYLEQHYIEPIELDNIASILSLSPSRTRHLFKQHTGKRFIEYLTFVRIQHAKRLLATGSQSVTEIYWACGFQSSASFYRSFQQLVGLTPSQYRQRINSP